MNIFEIFEAKKKSLKNPADNPCWTGYHPVGTKQKAGRTVPNCVPNANEGIGPDQNDPYEQGWYARPGQDFNPYEKGTAEHQKWAAGHAEREAQPHHYDEDVEDDMPDLEEVGEPVLSIMDAERRLAAGDRIFVAHEMDEEPFEVFNVDDLKGYTYDQMLAVPQGVAEGLTETRNSLFAFVKQHFPTWPDYVLKDFLYPQAKGIRNQAELDDFLKRIKQEFGNCKWTLTKLPITMDIFTPKTQRMIKSREGGLSNPFQVPRDAERHAQQSQMIQQKGVSAEPIIVAKLSNGYDLIEGWHRTIQHLKAFPQGYTGPAWVCTGATYKSENVEQGVAEGYAGVDDTDTVGFSVNTEAAYTAVMKRFGHLIDHDETSGIMYAPARVWPQIEMTAFDADGEGATRDDGIDESGVTELTEEAKAQVIDAVADFYKDQLAQSEPGEVSDYKAQAKKLLAQADEKQRSKVLDMLQAGLKNPYLQGAIITIVGSLVSGAVIKHFSSMGLSPQQFNMVLQGAMNSVIPTLAAKLHGMGWSDAIKTGLASVGVGVGAAGVLEAERNEMDTAAVQDALKNMAARHNKEQWSKEQLAALGKRLAAQNKKSDKAAEETDMEEDQWSDGTDQWSDGKGQWSDGRGQWSESTDTDVADYLAEMKSAGYDIK